ncbi:MAG: riboflavin biosynthesis protein RibF, partial [Acidobacteria bacterium]|nr:riboflavin biosynthesis protein RibF [Acidobacteriota bacterium]
MEIFHSWEAIAEKGRRAAVTVGNFDGMHLAHQELLRRVRQRAKER